MKMGSDNAYCRCEIHPTKEKENMEFDKSKILTAVTADRLTQGQMGWTNDYVDYLKSDIKNNSPYKVFSTDIIDFPFTADGMGVRRYFYPAPEPTYAERQAQWVKDNAIVHGSKVRLLRSYEPNEEGYVTEYPYSGKKTTKHPIGQVFRVCYADPDMGIVLAPTDDFFECNIGNYFPYFVLEKVAYDTLLYGEPVSHSKASYSERQAQWVKENNVKEGTKVRVTRTFTDDEDGSCCFGHDDLVGKTGIIRNICSLNLGVDIKDRNFKVVPYFALEVIKEPTYRPFNNNELNDLVGEVLTSKFSGRRKLVTGRPKQKTQVNLDGKPFTAEILLQYYYRNTDEPCGIREDD